MDIFDLLNLFGGLAMFLYGMRLMGDGLKESSSGRMKKLMEQVTNNPLKAFLLGAFVTALIQSSTATIVITSGLVAAGILSLRQSLGIIVGANVGTTITGQIIRLMDIDASGGGLLRVFSPSTLAPVTLILGIVLIMTNRLKNSRSIGSILIGFGVLFSGLLNMTSAVEVLQNSNVFTNLITSLSENPVLGYIAGLTVAFILQSSSAAVGILQAISASGILTFRTIYGIITGIYLGDCVTTWIVCAIGTPAEAKRVGVTNILYNLFKTALVLAGVFVLRTFGILDGIWNMVVHSGEIANANTVFNLAGALFGLPIMTFFEKAACRMVKEDRKETGKYAEQLESLNPVFFSTPPMALGRCYEVLLTIFSASRTNIEKSLRLIRHYDQASYDEILKEEQEIDKMADAVSGYLGELAGHLTVSSHVTIMDHYYKVIPHFERLGDYAVNLANAARQLHDNNVSLSVYALHDLDVLEELIDRILTESGQTFRKRDIEAALRIEPLEEVVDDIVAALRQKHMARLSRGECSAVAGTDFMDILSHLERISDICSDIGMATVSRVRPDIAYSQHSYLHYLHNGADMDFNRSYEENRAVYLARIEKTDQPSV